MLKDKFLKLNIERGDLVRVIHKMEYNEYFEEIYGCVDSIKLHDGKNALIIGSKLRINISNPAKLVYRADNYELNLDEILDLELLRKSNEVKANFLKIYKSYKPA